MQCKLVKRSPIVCLPPTMLLSQPVQAGLALPVRIYLLPTFAPPPDPKNDREKGPDQPQQKEYQENYDKTGKYSEEE
jgi:hypothetical protein